MNCCSVCQLYMDPFPFFPPKYCRVRGVHYTRVFWVRRNGSTPLRKLWAGLQRVATSMRDTTDLRDGSMPETLLEVCVLVLL